MSRSRSYQRSRNAHFFDRKHGAEVQARKYADVDTYVAYEADAPVPARVERLSREAVVCMLAAVDPPSVASLLGPPPKQRAWNPRPDLISADSVVYVWHAGAWDRVEIKPLEGRGCIAGEGAHFAMPEPTQPLGLAELCGRLERMGYGHWDALRMAGKIVRERAGVSEPEYQKTVSGWAAKIADDPKWDDEPPG